MFLIRECAIADFEQIAPLLRQLWPSKDQDTERLRASYSHALAAPGQHYVCAEEDGIVIAFCSLSVKHSLWLEYPLANIDELVVDAAHRGRGVGRALVDHMIALAQRIGCTRIELDSAFHRERAHAFYERLGFEKRAYPFSKSL